MWCMLQVTSIPDLETSQDPFSELTDEGRRWVEGRLVLAQLLFEHSMKLKSRNAPADAEADAERLQEI